MYDFSNEEEQKSFSNGPIPPQSCCFFKLSILPPKQGGTQDDPLITVSKTGLYRLFCEMTCSMGSYEGVRFYQSFTLPAGMQKMELTAGQQKSCQIGGAQIKAMLQSAKRPLNFNRFEELQGLEFAARVRLTKEPYTASDGKQYWNNELDRVLVPQDKEYAQLLVSGEIISDKPIPETQGYSDPDPSYERPQVFSVQTDDQQPRQAVDKVPF